MTRAAGLNRKTFYTNYVELDDLLNDCLEDFFKILCIHINEHTQACRGVFDFAFFTREYTRFALENQHFFRLLLKNHLGDTAFLAWQRVSLQINGANESTVSMDSLKSELYSNYCMYSCWGNILWVLNHSDLPVEDLVEKALSVYRQYLTDYLSLYQ